MRSAYYYDNVIPPKRWLVYSSLLWPKINVSPFALLACKHLTIPNEDLEFLRTLVDEAGFIDFDYPKVKKNINKDELSQYQHLKIKERTLLIELSKILGIASLVGPS